MEIKNIFRGCVVAVVASMAVTACTDEIKFGDAFIEKAPGGTVTIDTVFNSATYTQQFLTALYSRQYYGLPFNSNAGNSNSPYTGKFDGFTDCYHLNWAGAALATRYYPNTMTANNDPLMSYSNDNVWEVVRQGWLLIANIDRVPELTDTQKANMVAQTKCIIASRYFDLFMHYGGLPLVDHAYTGTEGNYELPRASLDSTVVFITTLLDEAIPDLVWAYNGNTTETNATQTGRWTRAGAMALKAKILLFAASPLFNADAPYYDGTTEAEQQHLVWYGNYDASRWNKALTACEDFFTALNANGYYALYQATSKTPDGYRQAYRMGYILDSSPEVLHYSRVSSNWGSQGTYSWWNWGLNTYGINRNSYLPTEEYVEMFPWSDGTPFDWETDSVKGRITGSNGRLFYQYKAVRGGVVKTASRDPRLYENAIVNGQQYQLDWTNGTSTGNVYEIWVGGNNASYDVANGDLDNGGKITENLAKGFSTGYGAIKYLLGEEYHRKYDMHWTVLSLDEMYLMYAEALAQTGQNEKALEQVDIVRARVGLKGLNGCNPSLNLKTSKENLIEEILRERACELGMSNNRFFDMVRYKRTDWMTKQLHGLVTYRMQQNSSGKWVRTMKSWVGDDKDAGVVEPSRFEYVRFPLITNVRTFWSKSSDDPEVKKYLMSPFPQTEINKGYGLIQNPGW